MDSFNENLSIDIASNSENKNSNFSSTLKKTINLNNMSTLSLNSNQDDLNKLKEIMCCRCIFCKQFPLIFYHERYFYLKCLYCNDVRTKIKMNVFYYRCFISLKQLIGEINIENILFKKGNFYQYNEIKDDYNNYLKINQIDNYCDIHKKEYFSFCEDCEINLCSICVKNHLHHKIKDLISYKLCEDELDEIKNIIEFLKLYNKNINYLIINKNLSEKLQNKVFTIMNIDYHKIPKSIWEKYPIIEKIKDFPILFHKFYLDIKKYENFDNLNQSFFENDNLIQETIDRIEIDMNDWETYMEKTKSDFEIYYNDINNIINIAEGLLDIYELNKNKLNYQICFNLKSIGNSLYYINDYLLEDDFEYYNLIINKYIYDPQIIKNYEFVSENFSKELLNLNLQEKKLIPIVSNLNNTSKLLNIPMRQLKIFNWIYKDGLCNLMIYNINLNNYT